MYFKAIIIGLFVSSAIAYEVPKDLPDGSYSISRNAQGEIVHTYLGPLPSQAETKSEDTSNVTCPNYKHEEDPWKASESLGVYEYRCQGLYLDCPSLQDTREQVEEFCGDGLVIPGYTMVSFLNKATISYVCNYRSEDYLSTARKWRGVMRLLNELCVNGTGPLASGGQIDIWDEGVFYGTAGRGRNDYICLDRLPDPDPPSPRTRNRRRGTWSSGTVAALRG